MADGAERADPTPRQSARARSELEMAPLNILTFLGGTTLQCWIALVIVTRPGIEYDLSMVDIVQG